MISKYTTNIFIIILNYYYALMNMIFTCHIKIQYVFTDTIYTINKFGNIISPQNVIYIDSSYNNLASLPENMGEMFPQLQEFYCGGNQLKSLPENMNFPQLQEFNCSENNLVSLPENMNFPQLQEFNCSENILVSLPENMNFPQLQEFNCSENNLVSLPENMNFPQLTHFYCSCNNLVSLPENMDKMFPLLQEFNCSENNLVSLPVNMNFPQLTHFYCSCNNLVSLPENMDKMFPLLQEFNCSSNNLTLLSENMNFPLLIDFNCSDNNLVSLPENMDKMFPLLQVFDCSYNKLNSLPENMNFPFLINFDCNSNNLVCLPENMNFPQLIEFWCDMNQITLLPENMNFPQLTHFYCWDNNLIYLPENMNFPQLTHFDCSGNNLTTLPICIMNWRNLQHISYTNNDIELSMQLERFLNRIRQGSVAKLSVYNDTQNVHNSAIQGSVQNSINRLTTRRDLPKFDSAVLNTMIFTDDVLLPTVKQQLIEYCQDDSVHSLLLLTFAEVLWYVLNTISHDFSSDISVQTEIKRVLNQEIQDAEYKCFTGRMNRVVNCLNGFSSLIEVKISDSEQIGNVIVMLKEKALDSNGYYSVEKHKQLVEHELQERGYDSETVCQWLEYIE